MSIKEEMIGWRHYLHQHPETAFEEKETSAFVAERLREMDIEVTDGIGGTGVVGTLKCGEGDKVIGIRADMDALAIEEKGCPDYVSLNDGRMHGCGHDGHVATLLGAAKILSESKDFNGTVRFIFQPAEEPGRGAEAMLKDGLFDRFPVDEIYALHNAPFLPAGTVSTRVGGMASSEDNFKIMISGKGGHASSPHEGVDPLACFSEMYLAFQTIVSRNAKAVRPVVISCTEVFTDGAHNAIPTHVEIKGDTRTTTDEDQILVEKRMRSIAEGICMMNGADLEFDYTHEFYPTINNENCVKAVVRAAEKALGQDKVDGNGEPWMASEDFAAFLKHVPGCLILLGSGKDDSSNVPLHNNTYDYNDSVLEDGARIWAELVRQQLN